MIIYLPMSTKADIAAFLAQEFPQFPYIIERIGARESVLRMKVDFDDLRPGGTVSGPSLFAIADAALYVAVLGEIGLVALAVTTDMTIHFLRKPAADQDLVARCRLIQVGRRLIVGEVQVYSDGAAAPVAHVVGTYTVPPSSS